MNNLQLLLKEINIIRESYIAKEKGKERFNIFSTLMKPRSEVDLHSRFLSCVLDPKGPHGMGDRPLHLFLQTVGSNLSFSDAVTVTPNNRQRAEYCEIDILLRDKATRTAVIIENKIDAFDSNHNDRGQLEGYYQTIRRDGFPADNIEVYYLTKDRHDPSDASISTNGDTPELAERIRCISYPSEILTWLQSLVREAYDKPFFRETLNQYINLLFEMTGNLEVDERKEIVALIGKNDDNLQSARLLFENFKHISWHAIADFNDEFVEAMKAAKLNVVLYPGTWEIDTLVHGGPINRNISFCYQIEDSEGIIWDLQSENDYRGFYLGVAKANNGSLPAELKKKCREYRKSIEFHEQDENWYFWHYMHEQFDCPLLYLWDFSWPEADTFDLISPQRRRKIIDSYIKVIKRQIALFRRFTI